MYDRSSARTPYDYSTPVKTNPFNDQHPRPTSAYPSTSRLMTTYGHNGQELTNVQIESKGFEKIKIAN